MSSLFVMQVMAMMLVLGWSFVSSSSPLSCEHGEYKIPPARFGLAVLASSRRFWVKAGVMLVLFASGYDSTSLN